LGIKLSIEVHEQLRQRTKQFALRIIRLSRALPRSREGDVIARQVLRSGTSVAANYRAAGRSQSRADFIAKISMVVEEADETVFWLELLQEAGIVPQAKLAPLMQEATELLAVFSASRSTAKRN
jgi:four helix bundle protein